MAEYPQTLSLGVTLLGLPLRKSENGYLVAEAGRALIRVIIEDCPGTPEVSTRVQQDVNPLIQGFAERLVKELRLDTCISVILDGVEGRATRSALYAAATTAVFRAVAEFHGEKPRIYEVLEYSSMLDEPAPGLEHWQSSVDALRYNALEGGVTVYRNLDEYFRLGDGQVEASLSGDIIAGVQRHNEDDLGPDLYGSLIHTVGITVLEASVRIRDAGGAVSAEALGPLLELQKTLAQYFWGFKGRGYPSPGLYGVFHAVEIK